MDNKRQEEMRCCCSTKEDSLLHPDPDPETERMIAEKEEAGKRTPEDLMLDVLENVRDAIVITIAEAEEWGVSATQMLDVDEQISKLAETALSIYKCIEAKNGLKEACGVLDKLRLMREVEQRNDESIKRWAENETLHEAAHGDEGTGRPWD